jgi:hypothetical protein
MLDVHWPLAGLALQIEAVDHPHGLGVHRIDDVLLLGRPVRKLELRSQDGRVLGPEDTVVRRPTDSTGNALR